MMEVPFSQHLDAVQAASAPFIEFLTTSAWGKRMGEPGICDFVAGNPQDMALPGYVEAIRRASIPQNPHWFAYKANEPVAREVAAASLSDRLTIPFDADDIFMTKGASTALAIALATVLSPGDEVIFLSPPWFFYESMIAFSRGVPVRVKVDLATFAPDIDAIDDAITSRTRAVIINSPNNPTGRIYPPETLDRLATLLTDASEQHGRTIYLLSDEAYNRILFDGRRFPSPATHYPNTSCSTATARRCWRPVSGSATSPSRLRCPDASACGAPSWPRSSAGTACPTPCFSTPYPTSNRSALTWSNSSAGATRL